MKGMLMLLTLHQDSSLDAHILKQEQKICFGFYLVLCDLIMSQVHRSSTHLLNYFPTQVKSIPNVKEK